MRKKLILVSGALGLLVLVVAALDPLGWFSGGSANTVNSPELAIADLESAPTSNHDSTTLRVIAMESEDAKARNAIFFARTAKYVERFEATRGWARIPLDPEQSTAVAALAMSTWSAAIDLPPSHATTADEVVLNLDIDASDLKLLVTIEGLDETTSPKGRIRPLGSDALAITAALYLEQLSNGSFTFLGTKGKLSWLDLPPGAYEIEISHDNCVTQVLQVRLQAGQPLQMPVELQLGAGITGKVTNAGGQPLANAEIALWQAPASGALEDPLQAFRTYGFLPRMDKNLRTQTTADGSFRFKNIAPGSWTALVAASGYRPLVVAQNLQAVSAETTEVGTFTPTEGFALMVEVVGANGQAVADAEVRWMKRPPSGRALPERPNSLPTVSDANGTCLLPGLPDGRIHLQIVHPDFAVAEQAIDIQQDPATPSLVEVVLYAGRKLTGRVVDIINEEPVAGVNLKILPRLGAARSITGFGSGYKTEVVTDAEGSFSFSSLPPDDYLLLAHHPSYAQTLSSPISVGEGYPQETLLHLSPGAELEVELLDTAGAPLPNTWVIALGEENQDFRREQTDGRGIALFEHMPAGTYKVMQADSVAQATSKSGRLHRDYEYCSLMDLEKRSILLGGREVLTTLEGFVLLGGKAVGGRRVVLLADDGTRIATSDNSGFYQFEDLIPGNYLFQVTHGASSSEGSFFGSVLVSDDAISKRDILLPAAELEVHILDARGGRPIQQIPINLRPADGTAVAGGQFQFSDENGMATFRTLRPGRYLVCAGEAALPFFGGTGMFGAKMVEVEIAADQLGTKRLNLRLPRSARFTADVRDPQGRPLENVHLHYENAAGQVLNRMSMVGSNANGFLELRGLPPGKGTIIARHPSFGIARTPVDLLEGQHTSRTIQLIAASSAFVQIVDCNGRPLTGVIATVVTPEGTPLGRLSTMEEAQQTRLAYLRGIEQKLGPLLPGRYSVKMFRPGEKPRFHPLEVLPNVGDQHLRFIY